jgi:hypothetical protein
MAFWEMVIGYLYTDRRLEMVQYAMFDGFRFICIFLLDPTQFGLVNDVPLKQRH